MFKKDKTLFITIILMLTIIISIILVVLFYENQNDDYLNQINSKNKSINILKDSNEKLENTVEDLEDEIEEISRENNESIISTDGDMATYYQSMLDLSDISLMIKEGKTEEAKDELLKVDPSGFDQTALSFYESLCRELNIEY